MTSRPAQPASVAQWWSASWVTASAFMRGRRIAALVAFPAALFVVGVLIARRSLYVSEDRRGVVDVHRQRSHAAGLVRMALVAAAVGVLGSGLLVAVTLATGTDAPIRVFNVAAVVLMVVLGVSVLGWVVGGRSGLAAFGSTDGPETPAGTRFVVSGLAQRPGTPRWSAVDLARRIIEDARPGDVFVGIAATEKHAAAYERLGFTRVPGTLRVHYVAP